MDSGTDKRLREMLPRPGTVLPGTANTAPAGPQGISPSAAPASGFLLA